MTVPAFRALQSGNMGTTRSRCGVFPRLQVGTVPGYRSGNNPLPERRVPMFPLCFGGKREQRHL
jgi:hypothetical protein